MRCFIASCWPQAKELDIISFNLDCRSSLSAAALSVPPGAVSGAFLGDEERDEAGDVAGEGPGEKFDL
jgi:hypothetical protein